jgi:hypothetical protein
MTDFDGVPSIGLIVPRRCAPLTARRRTSTAGTFWATIWFVMGATERADFYLGATGEMEPPNWGGGIRGCTVLGRPRLAGGQAVWRVRVEPPIPAHGGGMLDEVLLAGRHEGESIEDLRSGWISIYVLRATEGRTLDKEELDRQDWSIEAWAELALTPEELPPPFDVAAFWEKTLARIERFIERHGHSRVPEGYHDEDGLLSILVGNIRWHHAGKDPYGRGPFPGIDYAAVLDRLPGWEW